MTYKKYDLKKDERYLQLLSQSFPTIADASTEIINLEAIANLPKELNTSLPIFTVNIRRSSMC